MCFLSSIVGCVELVKKFNKGGFSVIVPAEPRAFFLVFQPRLFSGAETWKEGCEWGSGTKDESERRASVALRAHRECVDRMRGKKESCMLNEKKKKKK